MNSKTCHTRIPRLEDEYPGLAKVMQGIGKYYNRGKLRNREETRNVLVEVARNIRNVVNRR